MRCVIVRAILVLLATSALLVGSQSGAQAHGLLDQFLVGNPDCLAASFRDVSPASGTVRQEVTPATSILAGADLCLRTLAPATSVTLSIRSGNLAFPGTVLGATTVTVGPAGTGWVHFDLSPSIFTTPGMKILLELPGSAAYEWRSTCEAVAGACTTVDPDMYLGGAAAIGSTRDYAFRTFANPPWPGWGDLDQTLAGNPACTAGNFRGTVPSPAVARQEFVPSMPGLAGIDVCIQTFAPGQLVTLNLRSANLGIPGPIVETVSGTVPLVGVQAVHFDFADVRRVTPGWKYLFELPTTGGYSVRTTCGAIAGACTTIDPDMYPAGNSSVPGADLGFRTYSAAPPPDYGPVDQGSGATAACNDSNFEAAGTGSGFARQEFVPATHGLASFDLCMKVIQPAAITVNVREGTAAAPGPVWATVTVEFDNIGYQWAHFDLAAVMPEIAGKRYVLDLLQSSLYEWHGTCAQVAGPCTAIDPDDYSAGQSNQGPIVRDLAFRTYGGTPIQRFTPVIARDGP